MAEKTQTYKTHRRYVPVFHFFVLPVLFINVIAQVLVLNKFRTPYKVWLVLVALALAILAFAARYMASRVQDRVIRLEERIRLGALLPDDIRGRIDELTPRQLVALRFASDDELPALARRCLEGELVKSEQIKKEIKNWRPDYLRQ